MMTSVEVGRTTLHGDNNAPYMAEYPLLASLNPAQLEAVTAPPDVPLQILAGPGSGKTRVLTSRVAYLVQHHGYKPHQIVAVTFTNKAANEMRKRLKALLGDKIADGLILVMSMTCERTFHATCVKYLRRYGQLIDLPNNFSISDYDDCKKMMNRLIKAKAELLEGSRISLKDTVVLSEISKAKSKGEGPDEMAIRAASDPSSSTNTLALTAELYAEYEAALREANSLDFDDLLVYTLKLFQNAPRVLQSCFHILVDEFQDTNTIQYELMRCFAEAHGGVSVVGDPDQSIYGWRSAEIENLNKMHKDFPGTQAIYLEENYRSTGSILSAAHSVVSQDPSRIQKSLYTSHPKSTPVCLKVFSTPVIEASFISTEIKRLIAYSGGVLNYGDFAILLRYNALSRVLESALQKDRIPNRIVGGHKFFERMEIKDLLAYLQLAENPNFTPAFIRVVNVPKRAIGDKSVADIVAAAKVENVSPMQLCERITDGEPLPSSLKPGIKAKLANFVGIVRKLRRAADKGLSVADLLRMAIDKTGYEEYLRTSQEDWEGRWENVQELISFSVTVAEDQARQSSGDIPEDEFTVHPSAAAEAMAMRPKDDKSATRLHPMFRRTSTDTSAGSRRADKPDEEAALPRRAAKRTRKDSGVKEEPIEVLTSDEDDAKRDRSTPSLSAPSRHKKRATKSSHRPIARHQDSDLTSLNQADEASEVDKEDKPGLGELQDETAPSESLTPLAFFLQTSMLSSDTDADKADQPAEPKVTLLTVHAAKGLEWPVVFIPACEQGTYPSYRCIEPAEIAEERRLLYVAMTRAQTFLSMSWCQYRMMGGEDNDKMISEFVMLSERKDPSLFDAEMPVIDEQVRVNLAGMLERPVPDEAATKDMIMKHVRAAPPNSMWDAPEPQDANFNRFARREHTKAARAAEYWSSEADEYALPGMTANGGVIPSEGFRSARMARDRDRDRQACRDHRDRDRMSQPVNVARSPKPPPVILKPRDHGLPAPLPFTFNTAPGSSGQPGEKSLGAFTSANSSSLAMMKALGLPGANSDPAPLSGGSSPALRGSPNPGSNGAVSPRTADISSFESRANSSLSALKGLGLPDATSGTAGTAPSVPLAKGTKRLGMGRPAPWGAAKTRLD